MWKFQKIDKIPTKLSSFIWRYLTDKKWYLLGLFFGSLIWAIQMSFSPYLLKTIIDTSVQYTRDPTKLASTILLPSSLLAIITLIMNLNFRIHEYIFLLILPRIKVEINKDMLGHTLKHSNAFFQKKLSGNLTKKIWDLSDKVELIITIIIDIFIPIILGTAIASFTLFKVVNPLFGSILILWGIFFIIISYKTSKITIKNSKKSSESNSEMIGCITDSLTNISTIKLFNNISYEMLRFDDTSIRFIKDERALHLYNLIINFFQEFSLTILISSMLIALIYSAKQGLVSPGDFALILTLSMSFGSALNDAGNQIQQFSKLVGTCKQALTIIDIPHEITDATDAAPLIITKGEIKFNCVTFNYENAKPLFNQLTTTINPGEKIGLVGYSGGGKSSFIKLILRLMDPNAGQILIDNQDIKTITQHSLREKITTILQEPELFHRSIIDNIRFANLKASDEDVYEAAKKAHCHEFILKFPDQYQTIIGERGITLSGGQKQRIIIARAFLKNAPILLLDEATSSLDSITEAYIQEAFQEIMMNKTTIVIAHRLSTLKNMDRLLVFENGNIIEDGSFPSLLANKDGSFYRLWSMQSKGFIPK